MRVCYKGMNKNYNYRIAEINFDKEKEQILYDRIEQVMNIKGWNLCNATEGWSVC